MLLGRARGDLLRAGPALLLALAACGGAREEQGPRPVPAAIQQQLDRYQRCFGFGGGLAAADSDLEVGRLCAPDFRMAYCAPAVGEEAPRTQAFDLQLTLGLLHMMHAAAAGASPPPQDYIDQALADQWVGFARYRPELEIQEVVQHYPVGDAVYVVVLHDYHGGLPKDGAAPGERHYRTLLTFVADDEGWRLRDKVWVDAPR
jgi:hypothetical protein